MTRDSYTPGPWFYSPLDFCGREDNTGSLYVSGDLRDGDPEDPGECCTGIAKVFGNATSGGIPEANARLIAAAPDLLAALRGAVALASKALNYWHSDQDHKAGKILAALAGSLKGYCREATAVHEAIAKAEGATDAQAG